MCGIAGYAAVDPRRPIEPHTLGSMLDRLAHRGPDDEGCYVAEGVALGHRRLSIIDVEHGHQPLYGRRKTTAIVANGEIYNFRELARDLEALGHRLRTRSDTEVAVHAYDAWGLDFLDRIEGMYALAIWDGERRRLVLARDRAGEKPLYYTVAKGWLIFGSELTAVLAHPAVERTLDERALSEYLALDYVPAPGSIVRGVQKLEPATALILEDGGVRKVRYWTLDVRPAAPVLPYHSAVRRTRELLEEAVDSRLVSDVPLGVFCSGGIDSSAVAALVARRGPVQTFSIGFEESSFDESRFARRVADRIGSTHHERVLRPTEMPELVPRLARILDEPLGDASIVPTTLLSSFAREHVTVALGGDGGDEVFGGYPMHQGHRIAPLARRLPRWAIRGLTALAARLPVSHRNFAFGFKATTFLRGAAEPPPLNHGLWMSSVAPGVQRSILPDDLWEAGGSGEEAFAALVTRWEESVGAPPLSRAMHLDLGTYLPNDILMKVDRAGMHVALEVRAPLLSRSLIEFAFGLPDAYRMRGVTGKRILRAAVRDLVPAEVLTRPKKGFGIPVAAWLNGPLREMVDDLLGEEAVRRGGLFRSEGVGRLLREHRARRADHRKALWALLVFELWRREHLRPEHARAAPSASPKVVLA